MTASIRNANVDDFETIIAGDRPVLVDFWADWCGPCKALAPSLEELATMYEGEVDVVKVDIVANAALGERYGARSIPLLLMFKDGKEVARHVGSASKTRLAAFIDAHC